jgi:preprotein translocase subunit SecA
VPLLDRLLRAGETKLVKRLGRIAAHIDTLEADVEGLTDAELRAKTDEFRSRFADGETLDEMLPEAFSVVREAARRTIGQRPFTVQLMGGAALHLGNIAEMKTGEGKTLTSTLPAYLNAISGEGVHLVTVNDYLAKRDAENMGRIHRFLGLSVGVILSEMTAADPPRASTRPTSPTARTTSSASTTCATTWRGTRPTWCSAATTSPSSTRPTRSSSTRPARR